MNSYIHADIFFFVTTIAVVIVAIVFTVVLVYLALILSRVKKIADELHQETILFRDDIKVFREEIRHQGSKIKGYADFIMNFFFKRNSQGRKKKN